MSDNPFGEPDDADRTVIRGAMPRAPVAAAPVAAPASAATEAAPRLRAEAEDLPRVGPGPLAAAASPLLAILSRLANAGVAGQPNVEALHASAMQALRGFEAEARAAGATAEEI